jgi:hypothetical protein
MKQAGEKPEKPAALQHIETDQGQFILHPDGTATPLTFNGQPLKGKEAAAKPQAEQIKAGIAKAFESGDQATVKKLQGELKAIDPEGAQRINIALGNQDIAKQNVSRTDVRQHDKAYVQPAEAVEKSYQMMNNAYNDYKAAKAEGKELPTGAESMLALSTHLSTTFGNVKGAKITKDMIEHHLGARSISDSALAAVQKLTNGDVLAPAQWEAFHKLISESRNTSWQIAEKEANRKKIPVDFLPPDVKQGTPVGGNSQNNSDVIEYVRGKDGKLTRAQAH